MTLLMSLRHRTFALLWGGQTILRLGDSLYAVALAWWVLEKTGSATAMGTVLIISFIPMLLFLLIGGIAFAFMMLGVMMSLFSLIWTNTLQELVPRELMGRVSSIDFLGSFVLLPVGYGVAGWATDLFGAPLVFLIGDAASAGLALLGLAHPAIRNLD